MFHQMRTRLDLEAMENRTVPSIAPLTDGAYGPALGTASVVYVESNNPAAGQNAVLAYLQTSDGRTHQIGTFATGGTGQLNVPKVVGPDDGDQQEQVTADGRFLFAVNEGSDTVTAFRIRADGGLDWLGAFASGGVEPDSIGIAGDHLYVANRGNVTAATPGTVAPNVTAFDIHRDGTLTAIPNATVAFPVGTFVTQTLVSPDNTFLFVESATLNGTAGGNTITTFKINGDGTLTAAPGGPAGAGAGAPILLGAAFNPTQNVIYAGFTSAGEIGVFTFDGKTGQTTFVGTVPDAGAGPCWCKVSADGRFLYVTNTASDSIGVYSLADPLHPVQIQNFQLAGPLAPSGTTALETNSFELALDPTGHDLYVVTQSTNTAFPQGNQLHTLTIAGDGTLTEPNGPEILAPSAVGADAHPQGVAVVELGGHDRGGHDWFGFGIDLDGHDRHHWGW